MTFGYGHIFLRSYTIFLILSVVEVEPFILTVFKKQLRSEAVLHVCWLATSVFFYCLADVGVMGNEMEFYGCIT